MYAREPMLTISAVPALRQFLEVDLVAVGERDDRLAVAGVAIVVLAAAARPAGNPNDVDLRHAHAEQPLHRVADHRFRRGAVDLEGVLVDRRAAHAFLGDDRPPDDVARIDHALGAHDPSPSTRRASASRVKTIRSAASTA